MQSPDNLDRVWEQLEENFNPPTEKGLVGVAAERVDRWPGHIEVSFFNLSNNEFPTEDEIARCQKFINSLSEYRAKKIPRWKPTNVLSYILRLKKQ